MPAQPLSHHTGKHVSIVAIGGSAGGMEAVVELLQNLSPSTGMAFVYIQHLSPDHVSMLPSILGNATQMQVAAAKHLLKIEPDTVYIIPPNKQMAIVDGAISLTEREESPTIPMPVDHFFTSLADKRKNGAIGVILSGTGNDGTYGLRAIRTAGGVTIAQDASAKFPGMPHSAIEEGVVDLVLPPSGIAKELERLSNKTHVIAEAMDEDEKAGDDHDGEEELNAIIQVLKKTSGVDFTHYKTNTIRRRIIRRMLLNRKESVGEYLQLLQQDTMEANSLYRDLLINVTTFFRDPDTAGYLREVVFPRIIKARKGEDAIRIWVPGCSTGEEAYSLAMLLVELVHESGTHLPIQIFGTDLSEVSITKARLGLYSHNELVNVTPGQLQRFFTRVGSCYRIIKSIRDLCVFASHNVLKDPPFSKLDLVSCCNVMIYLDPVLQKKILSTIHYSLNSNGYLVVGKSETVGAAAHLFAQAGKKYKVFSKNDTASGGMFEMQYRLPEIERTEQSKNRRAAQREVTQATGLEKTINDILLLKYVPASVLVNYNLDILQFRGSTGVYLEPAPGRASLNLLKMARPGLAFELRSAVHKANKSGSTTKKSGIKVNWNDKVLDINFEVVPLNREAEESLFLIVFNHIVADMPDGNEETSAKDDEVKQLQDELLSVREDMRSIVEEQEASNEELQSANEEILSSNEELQSINEELETSKEELESSNEELMTINAELQLRNDQLAEAQEYTEAVFDTIRKAVLVLDKDLRIKSGNKAFYTIFQVNEEATEGTLIYELGNGQWDIPELRELLKNIITSNTTFEGLKVTHTFPHIGKKAMLLNAQKITQKKERKELILLSLEDITEQDNGKSE